MKDPEESSSADSHSDHLRSTYGAKMRCDLSWQEAWLELQVFHSDMHYIAPRGKDVKN